VKKSNAETLRAQKRAGKGENQRGPRFIVPLYRVSFLGFGHGFPGLLGYAFLGFFRAAEGDGRAFSLRGRRTVLLAWTSGGPGEGRRRPAGMLCEVCGRDVKAS